MVKRLRFFFVSILILYGWFFPGEPLFESAHLQVLVPVSDGLIEGGIRIVALCIMMWAVSLLLQSSEKQDLISALTWLLTPLKVFNRLHERLALRMTLTLQNIEKVSKILAEHRSEAKTEQSRIARINNVFTHSFQHVLQQADNEKSVEIEIRTMQAPGLLNWYIPIAIVMVFMSVSYYA
jgi:energy-coupling factor transport system permease protein